MFTEGKSSGALDGGPHCHMSNLRNRNVPCGSFFNINGDLKINVACQIQGKTHVMSLIFFPMSIGSMPHVDFKKWPCRRVKSKVKGPSSGGLPQQTLRELRRFNKTCRKPYPLCKGFKLSLKIFLHVSLLQFTA